MNAQDGGGLRVSDQDRERAAGQIREHFAEGRLTEDELSDRLSAVYSARTSAELEAIGSDLPDLPVSRQEARAELVARRRELSRRMIQESGAGLTAFLIATGVWAATGAGQFWPIFVLLVTLVPLVRNGWRLYGPAPELDRVERELSQGRSRRRHQHRGSNRRNDSTRR